jgi:hypothetical protein
MQGGVNGVRHDTGLRKIVTPTQSSYADTTPGQAVLVSNTRTINRTKDSRGSWVQLTLERALVLRHYALRHGWRSGWWRLRNWQLLGSSDGQGWEVLKTHTDDRSLPDQGFGVAHWPVPGVTKAYRCFRILMTGPNSYPTFELCCAGFNLFGVYEGNPVMAQPVQAQPVMAQQEQARQEPITVECAYCGQRMRVPAGTPTVKCPKCNGVASY